MNSLSPSLGRKIVYADRRNEECVDRDISLVTYNILADFYLQPARTKGNYKRCPKEYAARHQDKDCLRHKLLFSEFQWLDADIVCLQEVDPPYFNDILKGEMSLLGYQGLFAQKDKSTGRLEGIALFYKHEKFDLQEARKMIINEIADEIMPQAECREFGEVVILATLRDKITKTLLVIAICKAADHVTENGLYYNEMVHFNFKSMKILNAFLAITEDPGNTHILWGDLLKPVTQACEIALVTQALRDKVASLKLQGESVAYILCGDFNIDPPYPAYELLNRGKLDEEHFSKLQTVDYLKFAKDVNKPQQVMAEQISLLNSLKEHIYNPLTDLQSAYKVVMGSEPECTSYEDDGSLTWTTDYIWFDSKSLMPTAALETIPGSKVAEYGGFPSEFYPSDHVSLKAHFKFVDKVP